ncbi:MAG: tetratricopeptide repeat protein [Pseudomonadota bacterium]
MLAACSSLPAERPAAGAATTPPAATAAPAVVPGTWSADTLYDLLLGEVAGQRDRLDEALAAYLRQAHALRDPALAARATRIAWYARQPERIREASTLWAELAPQDPEANANAVMGLIQAGAIEEATPLLDRLLADPAVPVRFNFILQYAQSAEPDMRARLTALLAGLSTRHPGHARLLLARAALAELAGQYDEALALVERARELEPDDAVSIELEGRLLAATGRADAARRRLQDGRERFPDDRDLRLTHLRVLLEQARGDDARRELTDMQRRWPDDGDLALSLAMVEWETGHPARAKQLFIELAESGYREDEAWNYAGRVALAEGHYEEAAGYFQNVRGAQFVAAQVQVAYAWQKLGRLADARALIASLRRQTPEAASQLYVAESELLARAGDAAGARALLDQALATLPDDDDLRYARAMAAERLGQLDVVEADLRLLLAEHPDNAMLLNALGYTLADRTTRYAEAQALIEQALALAPDDPAIIDSMGWVLFRLGRVEEAVPWLRRAYALSPDPEIAAHLGEALWTLGKRREAKRIWERARIVDPDNAALQRTLERLLP